MPVFETKDYEVAQFKKGDFQDNFGNFWCDMALKGVGEPVRIAVKDPTAFHDGMTLYGTIETKESRAGKDYLKFKRMEKEEQTQAQVDAGEPPVAKKEWQPRDDDAIRAQWAIGQAVQLYIHNVIKHDLSVLETSARTLYALVDRIKSPAPSEPEVSVEEQRARAEAARDAERIRNTVRDEIIEPNDEPINMDDIPF